MVLKSMIGCMEETCKIKETCERYIQRNTTATVWLTGPVGSKNGKCKFHIKKDEKN